MQVLTSTKEIEMWGDGKQTRSFTYIDDCVEGILRVTKSDFKEPLNVGSSEMVGAGLWLPAFSCMPIHLSHPSSCGTSFHACEVSIVCTSRCCSVISLASARWWALPCGFNSVSCMPIHLFHSD